MIVKTAEITLYAPFVHSLKEKRMVVQSLLMRVRQKFPVSAAEVDSQDVHQRIVLGIAVVSDSAVVADGVIQKAAAFLETGSEAEVTDVIIETR